MLCGLTTGWGRRYDHPNLSSTEVKSKWSCTSISHSHHDVSLKYEEAYVTFGNKVSGASVLIMKFNRFKNIFSCYVWKSIL